MDDFGRETTASSNDRAGFCQDCGKPLTRETIRQVGSGVFCEPCLELRIGAAGQTVPAGTVPGAPAYDAHAASAYGFSAGVPQSQVPPLSHLPNPTLAGFLGLIPGVGAMYNGQFAKGIAHLVIFFVLSSLSDHVNGGFGILVAGWVFYQAFEAYHTAKARLVGAPLPNPLGLNDIGERMGFGKTWPGTPVRPAAAPASDWTVPPAAAPAPTQTAAPVPPVPPGNWAGYVPPSAFAQPVPPPTAPPATALPPTAATQGASWTSAPYQAPAQTHYVPPYVPTTPPYVDPRATLPTAPTPIAPSRRFPIAALVLILLGLLFLLNTLLHFELNVSWVAAAVLACLSVWVFAHRLSIMRRDHPEGLHSLEMAACLLRWPPVMLAVLAVLFFLQAADRYTLGQTWPVIVITMGGMLLLERTAGRAAQSVSMDAYSPATPQWSHDLVTAPVASTQLAATKLTATPDTATPDTAEPIEHAAQNGGQR